MKVSVIIPAYNAGETIGKTLESLLAQTFPHWEAIVVDDGSSDDTLKIATRFAEQDSRIRVVNQQQMGVSAARNTGTKEAKFDWLLFLDGDDWILPQHLELLTQAVERDPNLDAVYSGWARVTPKGEFVYQEYSGQPSSIFTAFARNCVLVIHSCIVRRAIVSDLGGFDSSLRTCEEWDLWQRIARTGARFGRIPDALACYRMRPNSASSNELQMYADGLRVIATGHSSDPRVPNPSLTYADGMPAAELQGAKLSFLCWIAGLLLGSGKDPLALLSSVQQEHDPGLFPETVALSIFWSAFLPQCQTPSTWNELWLRQQGQIKEFLTALEARSLAPALACRVCQRLENLILEHSTDPRPLSVGSTYGVRVEVTEPILDLTPPLTAERLHCAVEIEGKPLGNVTLPICDGFVSSYVLKDAIAAKFAWMILEHFFHHTVYCQLTVKRSGTGSSLWRDSLCVADGLPEDEQALWSTVHDSIGWTIFLQELWGRSQWQEIDFYTLRLGKKAILQKLKTCIKNLVLRNRLKSTAGTFFAPKQRADKQRADKGWLTVEVSKELPNVSVSTQELQVIPTVGGVALGSVPIQVKGNIVRAQQLRAAITKESGFELAVAAVREGLLGRPIAGLTLRDQLRRSEADRLANKPAAFSILNSEFKASEFPIQNYGSDGGVVLARYQGDGSSNRRAMLPQQAAQDLIEAASVAGEPVVKVPGSGEKPERVVYAPELIWFPPKKASLCTQKPESKAPIYKSGIVNPREHFETLFAKQADPWKYTSPYEQKKYEQTLELLPSIRFEQVLELACAEGHFTMQLAPRVGNLLATDISQVALERASQRCAGLDNIRFQLLDLAKDLIPGCFDLIICSEVLYYIGGIEELRAFAHRVADSLNPGGYFITAHANLVVDEPNRPGYNWGHPFGAKVIGETFASTYPLQLVKELRTPLYRIQVFRSGDGNGKATAPEIIELPQPTPPPAYVAKDVLWNGGSPQSYGEWEVVTAKLPILMYHRVHPNGSRATASWRVTPQAFEEQLRYLRDAGYYSVKLEDWRSAMVTKQPLAGRAVLITFDDGYQDFIDYAWPLLKRYGFSATVFLVAEEIGRTNHWDSFYGEELPLLGWQEIRQLQDQGVEFGSHSATHRHLTALSPLEITREGARSRSIVQQVLGQTPKAFAYPYGDTDAVVQHLIGACGYVFGLSCKSGLSRFQDSLLALPRIEVIGYDGLQEFVAKLSQ